MISTNYLEYKFFLIRLDNKDIVKKGKGGKDIQPRDANEFKMKKINTQLFQRNPRTTFSKALASLPGTLYQHFGSPLRQQ